MLCASQFVLSLYVLTSAEVKQFFLLHERWSKYQFVSPSFPLHSSEKLERKKWKILEGKVNRICGGICRILGRVWGLWDFGQFQRKFMDVRGKIRLRTLLGFFILELLLVRWFYRVFRCLLIAGLITRILNRLLRASVRWQVFIIFFLIRIFLYFVVTSVKKWDLIDFWEIGT